MQTRCPESLKAAIDAGAFICQTRRVLAQRIGINEGNLSKIRAGERGMPHHAVAALAEVLQLPPDQAKQLLAVAARDETRDPLKRSLIERAFFGLAAMALGSALLVMCQPAEAKSPGATCQVDTRYIAAVNDGAVC